VIRSSALLNFKSYNCFSVRTVKINIGDLKSRIETCQKDCASLKDRFSIRVGVNTNLDVKKMGTFLLFFVDAFL
jgi:hypothetical protein